MEKSEHERNGWGTIEEKQRKWEIAYTT